MTNNSQLNKIIGRTTSPAYNLKQENRQNILKWESTGLLEGLKTDFDKAGMAIMLENQARQLVKESNRTGTSAGSEEWNGVALPLVRRIFGQIVAKEFVSVQPMSMPSGLVFYLDFKYGGGGADGQPGFTRNAGRTSQADSIFGITNTTDEASQGLYGSGRFGYSINDKLSKAGVKVGATPGTSTFVTSSLTTSNLSAWDFDTEFFAEYSASIVAGHFYTYTFSTAPADEVFTNPDLKGVRAFIPSGSFIKGVFQQFTKTNQAETQITFVVSASSAGTNDAQVFYQVQPPASSRGDFEDQLEGNNLNIPELNLELRSEEIVAKTRKLKSVWTPEFAQDLNAYHAIDAEAELTQVLSEYITHEVDLEILDMLISKAANTEYWSAVTGRRFDTTLGRFDDYGTVVSAASAYTQQTWFQTLGTKVAQVSNAIHQKTMRGGANFMAVSPKVATILESIQGYSTDAKGDDSSFTLGSQKVGSFNGRIQVYKIPYMLDNTILLGYKGNQFLETGAVYAPYIPLMVTQTMYDPDNFTPRKGVSTRYAKKMIRPEFFGKIYIEGLNNY